jgi:hypothetical protein
MRKLKIKVDESRTDRPKLERLKRSILTTVRNMASFPDDAFLKEIIYQILINEKLDDKFTILDIDGAFFIDDESSDKFAVKIEIVVEKFKYT